MIVKSLNDFNLPELLPGRASVEGTSGYFERLGKFLNIKDHSSWFIEIANSQLKASRLGFGCYRVTRNSATHFEALKRSLLTGTNVIDTSTNYTDGSSELLIGSVLRNLIGSKNISRDEIIVISKAGYIQGENKSIYSTQKDHWKGVIELSKNILHSIHPDFLNDQLEMSRKRLGLETIDVYLLHNPEYHLHNLIESSISVDEAKDIYYERIKEALLLLEEKSRAGRIGFYGISSNDFASTNPDLRTDINRILSFAPPGFRVIQFPVNLMEFEHLLSPDSPICKRKNELWTIGNRPFNALTADRRLIRLAGFIAENNDRPGLKLEESYREVVALEKFIVKQHEGKSFRFDDRTPAFSSILNKYKDRFDSPEHHENTIPIILESMNKTLSRIRLVALTDDQVASAEKYAKAVNASIKIWEYYIRWKSQFRVKKMNRVITERLPELKGLPLSLANLETLLSLQCPQTILAGMRRAVYVEQLQTVYNTAGINRKKVINSLPLIKKDLEKVIKNSRYPIF